ncbi:MAG: hypothetical protein AAB706_04040, partial [Patescibacteria group bacterium]
MNKKILYIFLFLSVLFLTLTIAPAEAAKNDSSISLKKSVDTGFFTLTISDPDGLQEFSMTPTGEFPYGGGLGSCPKSFSNNLVSFSDPDDFTPVMPAYVIDCKNNTTNLEIAPPKDGLAKSKLIAPVEEKKETPPPPKQEEKKEVSGAPTIESVEYPVKDLGNCGSEAECRSYCDNANNAKECLAFAKKYNLISDEEAKEAADKFLNVKNGPGSCNSWASCEAYCSTVEHLDECIAFAEETDYYSPEQLAEAKKFQELVKNGTQFPGDCKDRNACEFYCSDANHMQECLDFAEKSGFMPPEEIKEARQFLEIMQRGESPGGCTSKEQCEKYCLIESHVEECVTFFEKAGFISSEEAEILKKTGGKGPGECRSKEQCDSYCSSNAKECFGWAKDNGLISEEDLTQMREGMTRLREELDTMPPEAVQCLKDAVGEENFNRMLDGEPIFDRTLEGRMKSCFSQMTAQFSQQFNQLPPEAAQCIKDAVGEDGLEKLKSGELDQNFNFEPLEDCFQQMQESFGGGGNFGAGGFSGPGGCKNTEECTSYCQTNPQECQDFGPQGGGPSTGPGSSSGGGFSGPGGCTNPEECQTYCQTNPVECQGFGAPGAGGGEGSDGSGSGTQNGRTNPELPQDYQQQDQQQNQQSQPSADFGNFNIPPEIQSCVGEEILERVKQGLASPDELSAKITACYADLYKQSAPPSGVQYEMPSSTPQSNAFTSFFANILSAFVNLWER